MDVGFSHILVRLKEPHSKAGNNRNREGIKDHREQRDENRETGGIGMLETHRKIVVSF